MEGKGLFTIPLGFSDQAGNFERPGRLVDLIKLLLECIFRMLRLELFPGKSSSKELVFPEGRFIEKFLKTFNQVGFIKKEIDGNDHPELLHGHVQESTQLIGLVSDGRIVQAEKFGRIHDENDPVNRFLLPALFLLPQHV